MNNPNMKLRKQFHLYLKRNEILKNIFNKRSPRFICQKYKAFRIKENLSKWKGIMCLWIRRLNTYKTAKFPHIDLLSNTIPSCSKVFIDMEGIKNSQNDLERGTKLVDCLDQFQKLL